MGNAKVLGNMLSATELTNKLQSEGWSETAIAMVFRSAAVRDMVKRDKEQVEVKTVPADEIQE